MRPATQFLVICLQSQQIAGKFCLHISAVAYIFNSLYIQAFGLHPYIRIMFTDCFCIDFSPTMGNIGLVKIYVCLNNFCVMAWGRLLSCPKVSSSSTTESYHCCLCLLNRGFCFVTLCVIKLGKAAPHCDRFRRKRDWNLLLKLQKKHNVWEKSYIITMV